MSYGKYLKNTTALSLGATLIGAVFAPTASAQNADAATTEFDEIVVTGSRIIRKDIESVSPLAVTSATEIKFSGHNRVEDLLNSMPQVQGSTAGSSFLGNGSTGTASVDLRGLGANRTLVLVNGRRLQPGGIYTNAADVNQIPAGLLKQVEVLTGGASSTYGADAVAGVVNFVIDKEFEGLKITAGAGGYQHNNNNQFMQGALDAAGYTYPTGSTIDGGQYNFDIAMGSSFADGKGHVSAYVNYRTTTELRQEARDYSSCSISDSSTCGGSGTAANPNITFRPIDPATGDVNFDPSLALYYQPGQNSDFISSSGNRYNYAPINHFQKPDKRYAGGAFLNYEFNEHARPYMEVMFSKSVQTGQYAESGTFGASYRIRCSNPLLSDTQRADVCGQYGLSGDDLIYSTISKRNVEGGPRRNNLTHSAIRFVVGSEGQINDNWRYDVSLTYGSTTASNIYENDYFAPNITRAIENVTVLDGQLACGSEADRAAGCIPYQIFTRDGITSEQARGLTATATMNGQTQQTVATAFVAGDLPFAIADDPVQTVFGVEYRKEQYDRTADQLFELGLLRGTGAQRSIYGQYDVKEFFSEAIVPLIQDAEFAQSLVLELGFRYSDYSTTGSAATYKIGATWQPLDELKFRGGFNRVSRAPNARELYQPQVEGGLWTGNDGCAGATPVLTAAQCANQGVTAAQYGAIPVSPAGQYGQISGGNPGLDQETAKTITFGLVAAPIDGMNLSVDYWDIRIDGIIGTVGSELAVTQCGLTGNAAFCDLINRGPAGDLWIARSSTVTATNQNLGYQHTKGIDIAADYATDLGDDGHLRFKFMATRMLKSFTQSLPDYAPSEFECAGLINSNCVPTPKWRHTMAVNFDSGSFWNVGMKWRYLSGTENNIPGDANRDLKDISSQSYIDLTAGFEITENISLAVGINNIFDKEPPLVNDRYNGTNANTFPAIYDPLGRRLFASITAQF